jgi:hypothetical protein
MKIRESTARITTAAVENIPILFRGYNIGYLK